MDHGDRHLLDHLVLGAAQAQIGRRKIVIRSGMSGPRRRTAPRWSAGSPRRGPSRPPPAPRPRRTTATLSIRAASSSGMPSSASPTSSSNRSGGTSSTASDPLRATVDVQSCRGGPGALLDGLDDAQAAAVTTPARPLAILAGAGLGQDPGAHPAHRLAGRHRRRRRPPRPRPHLHPQGGRRAARPARRRWACATGVAAGTFHAIAYAQLRQRWADQGTAAAALLDRKVRLLSAASCRTPRATVGRRRRPARSSGPRPA